LLTAAFDLRRHVTLGGKSPEPVSFAAEATLGMIIVPTTGVFPGKVFCTKRTEEEFVICQVLSFCISASSNPFLRGISLPVSDFEVPVK